MKTRPSRRGFMVQAAASAMAAPAIVPTSVFGQNAPSNRINLGVIGMGGQGRNDLKHFLRRKDVQCLAICDCFGNRRKAGKQLVDERYQNADCRAYRFHEELLERQDIDAVLIVTGDRWHAVLSVLAAKAGKDVYCEKPFCLTIGEGRSLVEATKHHETIWQCGTQRRSNRSYQFVAESVREGKIGQLHTITTFLGRGFTNNGVEKPTDPPDPEVLDYDRWTGQAPLAPYSEIRVKHWRAHWATGGGLIADMGPHYFDMAQWANDSEMDAPHSFEGTAVWPPKDLFVQTPYDFNLEAHYGNGVKLVIQKGDKGVRFDGDEGWIHITDGGAVSAEPESILGDQSINRQSWAYMDAHISNFIDCIRSRELTVSHPELAHRNHTICHAANICLRLGRKVQWDTKTETFLDDDEANALIHRPMRSPWQI